MTQSLISHLQEKKKNKRLNITINNSKEGLSNIPAEHSIKIAWQ